SLVAGAGGAGLQVVPADSSTPVSIGVGTASPAQSTANTASLNLDLSGLAGKSLPVLVIGGDGGTNPIALNGGGVGLSIDASLVVKAQGKGGRVDVAGTVQAQSIEIHGPGQTTSFADETKLIMDELVLIDDSVRAQGTVNIVAGADSLTPADLTITGRVNGTTGLDDVLTLQTNGGSVRIMGAVGNGVGAVTVTSEGAGYADGTYEDIDLLGGSGTGAVGRFTVSGGKVTSFAMTATGSGYRVGDELRVARSSLGALSARGVVAFGARVDALMSLEGLNIKGAGDLIFEDKVYVDGDLVIEASGNVTFLDQLVLMNGGRLIIEGAAELYVNNSIGFEKGSAPQKGSLSFTGADGGATVTLATGAAVGEIDHSQGKRTVNRVSMTGVNELSLAPAKATERFDLLVDGGAMTLSAPIGQNVMSFVLNRLVFNADSVATPDARTTMVFDVDELRLRTTGDFGSAATPVALTASRIDIKSTQGNLYATVPADVTVLRYEAGTEKTASLSSLAGSIYLAADAPVSGADIVLQAPLGMLSSASGAKVSGGQLTVNVGAGVAASGTPLVVEVDRLSASTTSGSIVISEANNVTLVAPGLRVGSGSGEVILNAGGAVGVSPGASVATPEGLVTIRAVGSVGSAEQPLAVSAKRIDFKSAGGDLFTQANADLALARYEAGPKGTASVLVNAGSISLEPNASVTGDSIFLQAPVGSLNNAPGANLKGGQLSIVAGKGAGDGAVPLATQVDRLSAVTDTGGIFINEADSVNVIPPGIRVGSGSGSVSVKAGGDLRMIPPAVVGTAGGPVSLSATGDVGVSQIDSVSGPIRIDSGGAIYDSTGGTAVTNLRTLSSLTLNAVNGIGGFAGDDLTVAAGTIEAFNAKSGHIVLSSNQNMKPGTSGIRNEASDGYVALFSGSGRVESGIVTSASGRLVMLSGRTGLSEKDAAAAMAAISVIGAMSLGSGGSTTGFGSSSTFMAGSGGAGAATGFGATASNLSSLSSAFTPLSAPVASAPSLSSTVTLSSSPAAGVIVAGRAVGTSESATSVLAGAVGSDRSANAPVGQGVAAVVSRSVAGDSIGVGAVVGRSTSLMLDAAIKVLDSAPRLSAAGSSTISDLLNSSPTVRQESMRLRESGETPSSAPGLAPATAPTSPASSAPATPSAAPLPLPSQPATGSSVAPVTPAAPIPGTTPGTQGVPMPGTEGDGAAGRDGDRRPQPDAAAPAQGGPAGATPAGSQGGTQGREAGSTGGGETSSTPAPGSSLSVPTLAVEQGSLWSRLSRWLAPEQAQAQAAVVVENPPAQAESAQAQQPAEGAAMATGPVQAAGPGSESVSDKGQSA
ncbi:MAG: hypothetical protein RI906_3636, partial [Pseudomonadota bacterium]